MKKVFEMLNKLRVNCPSHFVSAFAYLTLFIKADYSSWIWIKYMKSLFMKNYILIDLNAIFYGEIIICSERMLQGN